ncbi:hypothetical protein LG299_05145 [Microbacterium lacus]|uniref:GTP pyrophosphokinase n=1 Tax=Microbacterium lacus TaxID=415217 RepID=UPI00384AD9EF
MSLSANDEGRITQALEVYDTNYERYRENAAELERRVQEALAANSLRGHVHLVRARAKDRISFERKLRDKIKKDPALHIEDVIGVRIITYYRDDAPWVEAVVRDMMSVHEGTYVNKADALDDTQFGYRSIQFVATMPWASRHRDLPFGDLIQQPSMSPAVAEVQIRSIVEHAWAEIEHKLAYHDSDLLPRPVRRRLALTAALIENVDEQLISIRNEVDPSRTDLLADSSSDAGHLQRIVETDRHSRALDRKISDALDLPIRKLINHEREVQRATAIAGLTSASQVRDALAVQEGKLGLRMEIVCANVEHHLILPDSNHSIEPIATFPGIGIYWTALALLHRWRHPVWSFNSVSEGRLAEYTDVGRYLLQHPDESALRIRDRYRAQAYPAGTHTDAAHELHLER